MIIPIYAILCNEECTSFHLEIQVDVKNANFAQERNQQPQTSCNLPALLRTEGPRNKKPSQYTCYKTPISPTVGLPSSSFIQQSNITVDQNIQKKMQEFVPIKPLTSEGKPKPKVAAKVTL